MFTLGRIAALLLIVWVCARTVSYALWVSRQKNISGGVMVMIIAAAVIVLPVYVMFFR